MRQAVQLLAFRSQCCCSYLRIELQVDCVSLGSSIFEGRGERELRQHLKHCFQVHVEGTTACICSAGGPGQCRNIKVLMPASMLIDA